MERGIITYIVAFITGIVIARFTNIYLYIAILVSVALLLLLLFTKRYFNARLFVIISHMALLSMGVSHYLLVLPYNKINITRDTAQIRDNLSIKLKCITESKKEHAVLSAITLGSKSEIPGELKKAYSNSGAMHILALSGLHIGIIYGIISVTLSFLNFSYKAKRLKFLLSVIIICFYSYITGFSPSVQRAGIMILVHNIATLWNRPIRKYDIIAISAFIITVINPNQLFNIGFQLSFAAILGIAVIYPIMDESIKLLYPDSKNKITNNLSENKYIRKGVYAIWGMIAISVACQITTMPFTIYYFGTSAPYFLLTNLAAIPIATAVLYVFLPAIFLSGTPIIGDFLGDLLVWLLKMLNGVVEFIG
ncbi:MAG: ComEC/Rec2 family competence protein [Bacteroidales bacterium]